MPQPASGRSHAMRTRAVSSVVSFDAPPPAAHPPVVVAPSRSLSAALPSTDRQPPAREDGGEAEEEAVVGGDMDDSEVQIVSSPTASLHSGEFSSQEHRVRGPRYANNTVIIEHICTEHTCTHCCSCHVRHPGKNGYDSCFMKPGQPWPDCRCQGRCEAGRCAQYECVRLHCTFAGSVSSNRAPALDVSSDSDSTAPPSPHSPQPAQRRHSDRVIVVISSTRMTTLRFLINIASINLPLGLISLVDR